MILVAPKMEKQCDYEMKVENFKVYLKKVSQLIAGGVRPEVLKEVAPTLSKHCNFITCSNLVENNITRVLQKCLDKVFQELDLTESLRDVDELCQNSTNCDIRILDYDPFVIRKHWLHHRREMLKSRLQESRRQSDTICDEIKKRRAVMEKHINTIERIQITQFQKILLA